MNLRSLNRITELESISVPMQPMKVCLCGVKQNDQDVYNLLAKAVKNISFPIGYRTGHWILYVFSLHFNGQPDPGVQGRGWLLLRSTGAEQKEALGREKKLLSWSEMGAILPHGGQAKKTDQSLWDAAKRKGGNGLFSKCTQPHLAKKICAKLVWMERRGIFRWPSGCLVTPHFSKTKWPQLSLRITLPAQGYWLFPFNFYSPPTTILLLGGGAEFTNLS